MHLLHEISDPRKVNLLQKTDNSTLRNISSFNPQDKKVSGNSAKRGVNFLSKAFSKAARGSSHYTVINECYTTNDNLSANQIDISLYNAQ